jgi:hypothetical protein
MQEEHAVETATEGFNAGEVIIEHVSNSPIDHPLVHLPVTNCKDLNMVELWDDRAVQVVPNTGQRADGQDG